MEQDSHDLSPGKFKQLLQTSVRFIVELLCQDDFTDTSGTEEVKTDEAPDAAHLAEMLFTCERNVGRKI